jgi:hypothetical protein
MLFALVHEHMYEQSVLVGIFTTKERVQAASTEYDPEDSLDLRILEVDHDPDLTSCGYCVFSHQEMFGQVCHIIEYVAKDPISAVKHAKRLHAKEKTTMESEWLYEPVEIDTVRLKDGEATSTYTYIKEIEYSWKQN